MPRYVAFLRGVSPMNARMPELKRCFEAAGFTDVRTLLSSGNVLFSTRSTAPEALERRAEKAMEAALGHGFRTIVRSTAYLQELLAADPFGEFALPASAKCVVTFLRRATRPDIALPLEHDGACILKATATEVFTAYEPGATTPRFMALIERTFGKEVTTRSVDTVRKCAQA